MFAHYDSCLQLRRIASLLLAIISMASSTATKKLKIKDGSKRKRIVDWFRGLKSGNASATQPNSTRVSISSASDHDPGQGNDAGNPEPTASGKHGNPISELLPTIQPLFSRKWCLASGYVLSVSYPQIRHAQPTLQTLPPHSVQLDHRAFQI